jgi:hypothetical protein
MTDLSPEAIERLDLARELTPLEKVQFCGELYRIAPGANSFEQRIWVAERLGLPLREINKILWATHGIRWSLIPAREPKRRRRKRTAASGEEGSPQSGEDITRLCDELQVDITDILTD